MFYCYKDDAQKSQTIMYMHLKISDIQKVMNLNMSFLIKDDELLENITISEIKSAIVLKKDLIAHQYTIKNI